MRHDLSLEGHAFRLRPIADADAQFVIELRTDPQLSRYLHPTSNLHSDQLHWFSQYYERPGDYYFVVERRGTGQAEGLVAIYDEDAATGAAEWGRWILRRGSMGAAESAWLIYRCAFERLALRRVYCRTVADNASVVSFHDGCGIARTRCLPRCYVLQGRAVDAIEHTLDQQAWPLVAPKLEQPARLIARRLNRV